MLHRARRRGRARRQHRQADLEDLHRADEPKPWKKQANGVQLYGPAAGGVWNAPTIDPVRGALYVGTGDAATPPDRRSPTASWRSISRPARCSGRYRATENDLFMGGCNGTEQQRGVPEADGPGLRHRQLADPVTLPNGKRALFAGTKGADVFALDPDNNGALLFRVNPAGGPVGFTGRRRAARSSGAAPPIGQRVLRHRRRRAGRACSRRRQDGLGVHRAAAPAAAAPALGAAPTAIPGVVFQGAGDGRLFAVSAADGKQLWEFNTAQEFDDGRTRCRRAAARSPPPARSSSTGWSTSGPATRSTAARRPATCCWRSGLDSIAEAVV